MKPFFISIPHAGEKVPTEAYWLSGLPETVLMCDSDRFVDQLYTPGIKFFGISAVIADVHRYVVDLNRLPSDIDVNSVEGAPHPAGSFTTGLLWSETTTALPLIKEPISQDLCQKLIKQYYDPFHNQILTQFTEMKNQGHKDVYHLDAHSMPSRGTAAHRDPGQNRAHIVVSDQDGTSCSSQFKDLVIAAYKKAGFEVAYNWPYKGGRITQTYGQPQKGQHTIQVEMNRALYMDEISKQKKMDLFSDVQRQISQALGHILNELKG